MKQHPIHIYHPLYTLKAVSNNIWIVDGDLIEMNIFGVKVPFSTRMTVVQLSDGTLWCHSPVQPTPELLAELNAMAKCPILSLQIKFIMPIFQNGKNIILTQLLGLAQVYKNALPKKEFTFISNINCAKPLPQNGKKI